MPPPDPAGLEIRAALTSLPEGDQELLSLVAWEGLDVSSAGRVLGIRPAAARKRLQRARQRLREALEEEEVPLAALVPSPEPD